MVAPKVAEVSRMFVAGFAVMSSSAQILGFKFAVDVI
jgi:hypothetical protein